MKRTLTLLTGLYLLTNPLFSQTQPSLKLEQELSFENGIGLNLISKYIQNMHLAKEGQYIVVKTNIPFADDVGMTSVTLNYWGYHDSWETVVGWYGFYGTFLSPNVYTSGISKFDHLKLFSENGKVCIAIPKDAFSIYGYLTVNKNVAGRGLPQDWAKNWTISELTTLGEANLTQVFISQNNIQDDLQINSGNLTIQNSETNNYQGQSLEFGIPKINFKGSSDIGFIMGRNDPKYKGIEIGPKLRIGNTNFTSSTLSVGASEGSNQAGNFNGDVEVTGNLMSRNKVVIGNDDPTKIGNYKLVVDGKIGAREIEVKTEAWADYVFNKDYELMSLENVEEYIECNGHLPNIPSAETIIKNGISIGEMSRLQQEKIEELMLYTIQQEKQIQELSEKIEQLSQLMSK